MEIRICFEIGKRMVHHVSSIMVNEVPRKYPEIKQSLEVIIFHFLINSLSIFNII